MINNPKALHSLTTLSIYKINIHFNQEYDLQTLALRSGSRKCLFCIQEYGDVYAHTDLVNANYARILVIAISTAGGLGEEQDGEISSGLFRISYFLRCLNQGKYNSFPPLPLLAQISKEQIEEEGGSEEIESQLINKGYNYINVKANQAKAAILNYFIDINNTRPEWYRYR
ncbi:MAG: hypothetical protein EZS28_011456 [Streblomastix strix]|uniref:Uncharacterized protein n=1 Tax=Streblomastix strix TaxID=222440 RepID=A0A5J4WEA3_9EUKA|nr:MAG: hypothetical protein EZS28_011456 [Streblomastix strix]